jgi:dethiobiotin synthetase
MMVKSIFIGGTGTDIGKTYVTCMLLRQLRNKGFKVRAIKPVISGFDEQAIEQTDSGLLLQEMGLEPSLENADKISPWRYREPLPPHLAAQMTGQAIIPDDVVSFCQKQAEESLDFLLIEGVGGIMTPLNYDYTTLDLIKRLGCHCLLVTGSSLGTLSHTLSAITCIKQFGITLDGVIISESLSNYTDFSIIIDDITKFLPNILIKKISRNNQAEEISSLVV